MESKTIEAGKESNVSRMPDTSNAFLYRTERQRLDSECLRPLDLRPHARGPCKRFSYRGRSLWLDREACQVFLEGLRNNAGVFTVETYESILRQFVSEETESTLAPEEEIFADNDSELLVASMLAAPTTPAPDRAANNHTIDLSYFEKRLDDRVKIPLNVEVIWKEQRYAAQTRDISISGLQLRLKSSIDLTKSDLVRVNMAPAADRQLDHPELNYRVVHVRHLLHDTLVALQCIESEVKDGLLVISDHIAASSEAALTEQSDPEDALLTAQALLAERFYMRSTSILPFFMFECREDASPLRIIFGNQVNRRHLDAFKNSQGNNDFSSLVTPKRIKLLTRLALRDSKANTLIAVYRSHEHSAPQVIADLECKNHKHWRRLLMRSVDQPEFRVFKVVARLAHQPVKMRLENALEPFTDQGDECISKLLEVTKTLSVVGALIDVTEQMKNWVRSGCGCDLNSHEDTIICCDKEQPLAPPQLVPIHYIQENRCEDRFLGCMQVEVNIAGRLISGVTRDVSAHGLSIEIDNPDIAIFNECQATISFPKLEARSSSLARFQGIFRSVPAELVEGADDGEQLLRFKISDVTKGHQFSKAFSGILEKRQSNLTLDTSHILRAATSRLYSSIFIESSSTLPVFIYRNAQGDCYHRFGKTTYPTPLIDFLEVSDGKYDFSFLTNSGRLKRIIQQLSVSGSSELTLFLCKERLKDAPSFDIRSLAEFEINDKATLREFVHHAMDHDFRCVKVVVNHPDVPPKAEIEQAINRLSQLSLRKSERLKAEFDNLIAIGDVVDITGLVAESWSEEPAVRSAGEASTTE
jgi:hypothetical protein